MKHDRQAEIKRLKDLLLELSVEFRPVVLSSGQPSDVYVDCKQTALSSEGAALLGIFLYEKVLLIENRSNRTARAVGGMSIGADPLATAVSLEARKRGRDLPAFMVRKTAKNHGTQAFIEGTKNFQPNADVIILEDVITTGGSALLAAERMREGKYRPFGVAAILDREVGGAANLLSAELMTESIFKLSEFKN